MTYRIIPSGLQWLVQESIKEKVIGEHGDGYKKLWKTIRTFKFKWIARFYIKRILSEAEYFE